MEAQQLASAANIDLEHATHLIDGINSAIQQADLSTPERLAAFIAQCAHESGGFKFLEENLNYKAESLCKVWPSHFNHEIANEYAHNPQKIASRAYANRMGNGDEESQEGWMYRGRGFLQTTGKKGYEELSDATQIDFVNNPDAVATPEGACVSAAVYWEKHGLNRFVDSNEFVGLTKAINGGTIGLDDRMTRYNHALSILSS
jgi:putative chitinase